MKTPKAKKYPEPSKKTRRQRERNLSLIADLALHWDRFKEIKGIPPLPLSIGIDEQIRRDAKQRDIDINDRAIKLGLRAYTKRISYIRVIANGGARFDLESNEVGKIEPEHQEQAQEKLAHIEEKNKANKTNKV